MPADRSSPFAVLSLCAATSAIAIALAGRLQPAASADDPALTLTRIVETRSREVAKPAAEEGLFAMSSAEPALTLTFAVALPAGTHIMAIEQPKAVTAVDSAGTDLAKIKPGFSEELEYVELEHDFTEEDGVSEITLTLLPSARQAGMFSVQAAFRRWSSPAASPSPSKPGRSGRCSPMKPSPISAVPFASA